MADLKGYWQEQARKAGLSEDQVQAVLGVLGDEKVAKAFESGFVTRSDYSRDLDRTRDEWKTKVEQYDRWYNEQAKPSYEQAQKHAQLVESYRKQYGDLDGSNPNPNPGGGLSKDELQKMLDERDNQRNTAYMRVVKSMTRAAGDFQKRFGDVLDVDAFEEFAVKRGGDPWDAYQAFIAPKVQEATAVAETKRSEEFEAKLKAAREEGARDALSRRGLPAEVKQQEISPFKSYTSKSREDIARTDDDAAYRGFLEEMGKSAA